MSSLRLNRDNARWLGVCAGIADWLDVPAALVRVVAIICVLSWPPLALGYLLLYVVLDRQISSDDVSSYFKNAKTAEHFRKLDYRKPIYKNSRDARFAGVCAGIADYLEVSPWIVRLLTLLSFFVFGPFTFLAYIICMFVLDPDPYADSKPRRRRRRHRRHGRRYRRRQARKSYANDESVMDSQEDLETEVVGKVDDMMRELDERVDEMIDDVSSALGRHGEAAARRSSAKRSRKSDQRNSKQEPTDRITTAELYRSLELRLREIEAYMTSKQFRLHCQLNRI